MKESDQAARERRPAGDRPQAHLPADLTQIVEAVPVVWIVDERTQMHGTAPGEAGQEVPGPDLVALGGRIRDPMREEEDLAHPRYFASGGPASRDTQSGRRRQAAIRRS